MAARPPDLAVIEPGHAGAPKSAETIHADLRRTTRGWHARVDAAYASFDLQTRHGLSAFLAHQVAALLPLEHEIEASGAADLLSDWPSRRRGEAILADLAHLGLAAPPPTPGPVLPSRLHGLGALYVLEGSKLGGRILLRRVVESEDPHVRSATRFLGHPNEGGWSRFLTVLNGFPATDRTLASLRAGAAAAFSRFLPAAADAFDPAAICRLRSNVVRSNQA